CAACRHRVGVLLASAKLQRNPEMPTITTCATCATGRESALAARAGEPSTRGASTAHSATPATASHAPRTALFTRSTVSGDRASAGADVLVGGARRDLDRGDGLARRTCPGAGRGGGARRRAAAHAM